MSAVLPPELSELVTAAREVRERAYAPYSAFRVGAAVRACSGRVFVGCNVENKSYGGTICAERAAILQMVSAGETALVAVAVFTDAETLAMPCGLCRQVIAEFEQSAQVLAANPREFKLLAFSALFPDPFVLSR
ncbi:MAG TPA: cytidine deaminase [Polyangiaceae bacterium]|jgi:cytidine deaminase